MTISDKSLYYYKDGQFSIALYDDVADVGTNHLTIYDGTLPLYAIIGDIGNEYASSLHIYKGGVEQAILTEVPPPPVTPALQVFITKEIYRDILQIDPEQRYSYAASPNNEHGTVLPSSSEVLSGTSVTFTPTAASGYSFVNWTVITSSGVSTVSGSTLTLTITGYTRVFANFT